MATISSITKLHCHARSNSLPSSSSNQQSILNEFYRFQASLEAITLCSSSSVADKLHDLNDMYESIQSFLILETTQCSLAQTCYKEQLNKFVDGLVELLDLCTIIKDVLSMSMNSAKELESNLRRKRGDKTSSVKEYLDKKQKVNKIICKSLSALQKRCSFSVNEDNRTTSNINILKEMTLKTLIMFEALFTFTLGSKSKAKAKGWSFVAKMMGNKNVESDQTHEESVVKKMDDELQAIIRNKETKTDRLEVKAFQIRIADLEHNLLVVDEQVDCLCRNLIKTRVSILNILNF